MFPQCSVNSLCENYYDVLLVVLVPYTGGCYKIRCVVIAFCVATRMKKFFGGCLIGSLIMLLVLRYGLMINPSGESYFSSSLYNTSNPLQWINAAAPPAVQNPENASLVISTALMASSLFAKRNFSFAEQQSLHTWYHLKHLIDHAQGLPNALEAIKEAGDAWNNLMVSEEKQMLSNSDDTSYRITKAKQCPHFLNKVNATELDSSGHKLRFPCGLTQGSSISIIGSPNGLLGNFRIDLTGEPLPGEPEPPIIFHCNVRLHGDQITEDPIIVQNTWTLARDWGAEERCPSPDSGKNKKVDGLDQCNKMVGGNADPQSKSTSHSNKTKSITGDAKPRKLFPFKLGYPFVATLRVGLEGIQMTVDGKHITSFEYREALEPWLVSEIRISGDVKLISVLASGLPTSEESDQTVNIEALKAVPLSTKKPIDLLIGVFSTANNFKHRMTVRRTWMQYPAVQSGIVAVRFFVGLHKNQIVNEETWDEAKTYGDVQIMPFVDYYSLITWKTLAICIFGAEITSAKYVMKTDDDAFLRVDEVLASLQRAKASHALFYGLMDSDSQPHRNPDSKWYISTEEWPEASYPTWAHGPGYVVTRDIAKTISRKHKEGRLKMFKLEDVAMGIWIAQMQKEGLQVKYESEDRIIFNGCKDGYVVAHYQSPREMLCLWRKLQDGTGPQCCGNR